MRIVALLALLAPLLIAELSPAQERHRTIGDFQVEIDKDPLTLDSNVTATARSGERIFGIRCLEGQISLGVGWGAPGERLVAGESVRVSLTIDGTTRLDLEGTSLNEQEVEIAGADPLLRKLTDAKLIRVEATADSRSFGYALPVRQMGKVIQMVALACGK